MLGRYRRALAAEPSDARYQQGLGAALHSAGAEGDNPGALSEAVEVYGQLTGTRGELVLTVVLDSPCGL